MSTPKGQSGILNVSLANYNEFKAKIEKKGKAAEKAIKRTVSDFKSRAPAWVSAEVTKVYNIKKAEVKDAISGKGSVGKIKIGGIAVDNVQIKYSGRELTPTHFKMKPSKNPAKKAPGYIRVPGAGVGEGGGDYAMVRPPATYNVSVEVFHGKRKTIGGAFLGSNGGGGYIPFQREGDGRTPIRSVKSVSIPQMITNPEVSEGITRAINEGLIKRLEHHLEQEMKKI